MIDVKINYINESFYIRFQQLMSFKQQVQKIRLKSAEYLVNITE